VEGQRQHTNLRSPRLAGVTLRRRLEKQDWRYSDGHSGPPVAGRWCCECYPYTTLVGAPELGYDLERPRYKRKPRLCRLRSGGRYGRPPATTSSSG
jgi:hypothetical protein